MVQNSKNLLSFLGLMAFGLLASDAAHAAAANTLGAVISRVTNDTNMTIPGVFTGFSYMMGLIMGFTGIMKLKEHVENPNQVQFLEPIKRFLAGGMFFLLPFVADVVREMIEDDGNQVGYSGNGWSGSTSGVGLDAMIVALMRDVFLPLQWAFGAFGYMAGLALVIIGISRLLKTEQQGPQGPTGIGTVMTFIVAGCLFSINSIIGYFSTTMFTDDVINTRGVLQYQAGLGTGAANHVHAVISGIIAFSIVIGWVSLIRGFFILRGVSEGSQQASMMAAITHLIGGVLAINLGSVIMAVQNTLNITQYGIRFD